MSQPSRLTIESAQEAPPGSDETRVVIAVRGELDPHTASLLADAVQRELSAAPQAAAVIVDLSGVEFIDSTGLRSILAAQQETEGRGLTFRIRWPSPAARRLLDVTNLSGHVQVE